MEEIRAYCKEKFDLLDRRMNAKSALISRHETEIEVLKSDLLHLTKSLNGLTRALWGMVSTIIVSLFSFFIWYIKGI